MVFAVDTRAALQACAAIINTASPPDTLTTVAELQALLDAHHVTGRRDRTRAEVEEVRRLRPQMRRLWGADEVVTVERVNAMLRHHRALPRVVRHDGLGWHIHAAEPDAPLVTRLAVEMAMALVDVVRAGELERLRFCAAEDCDGAVADLSRNRSKRYCDEGCGNRAHVAAFRARQLAAGSATERSMGGPRDAIGQPEAVPGSI